MEARNITAVGVWAFALIWLVGVFAAQADLLSALIIFFIAIAVSVGLSVVPKISRTEPKQGP